MAGPSRLETVEYTTTYAGQSFVKRALVYIPDGYDSDNSLYELMYLIHGSQMSPEQCARDVRPTLDEHIAATGRRMLVVFPTYYPDSSYVHPNYVRDDPLTLAFAGDELPRDLMPIIEGRCRVWASPAREHRIVGLQGQRHRLRARRLELGGL